MRAWERRESRRTAWCLPAGDRTLVEEEDGGSPIGGESVRLQTSTNGITWAGSKTVRTDGDGRFTFSVRVTRSRYHRVDFAGSPSLLASTSLAIGVQAR